MGLVFSLATLPRLTLTYTLPAFLLAGCIAVRSYGTEHFLRDWRFIGRSLLLKELPKYTDEANLSFPENLSAFQEPIKAAPLLKRGNYKHAESNQNKAIYQYHNYKTGIR